MKNQAFIASLSMAILNQRTVTVADEEFSEDELKDVLSTLKATEEVILVLTEYAEQDECICAEAALEAGTCLYCVAQKALTNAKGDT